MQTLKIEIPEGFEIDKVDLKSGEIKLKPKPKNITERIKSISDAIQELGEKDAEVIIYRKLISVFSLDVHVVQQQQMVIITKALNEGWAPDWSDHSEYKYYPYFEMAGSSGFRFHDDAYWHSISYVGSRLCFKTRELAVHAGKTFAPLYKDYFTM